MRLRSSVATNLAARADAPAMPPRAPAPALETLPPGRAPDVFRPPVGLESPPVTGDMASRFREFRASLMGRLPDATAGPVTIVIASAERRVHASGMAADLAAASAQVGYEVLMVDANLARPSLAERFNVANEFGVSNMGEWADEGTRGISPTPVRRLSVLPTGPFVTAHAEMMERLGLCRRLARIGQRFDMIVVDASAQDLAEAAAAASGSDGVIIAARRHRTPLAAIRRAAAAFADRGVAALGTVIIS